MAWTVHIWNGSCRNTPLLIYINVCNAKNETALKSLIANSQAYVLDANTKVIVIKRYFATSDIQVLNGVNKGEMMRIANEYLNCK